jgi:hypothetical protein
MKADLEGSATTLVMLACKPHVHNTVRVTDPPTWYVRALSRRQRGPPSTTSMRLARDHGGAVIDTTVKLLASV